MQTKNPQDGIAAGGQNASMAGSQVTGSVDQKAQPAGQKTDSGLGDMQAPAQRTPNMPAGAGSAIRYSKFFIIEIGSKIACLAW